MDNKYGKTPQQRLEEAIFQPMQRDNTFGMTRLTHELTNDVDYFYLWQSNIAMAFVDAYKKWHADNDFIFYNEFESAITAIANKAAENFLNNLCSQPNNIEEKKPNE